MVGANVKAETVTMMDKRKAVENEMDAIIARLTRPGGPGLQGNLVDAQGFPRADLDIPAVRSDRQRLSGDTFLHSLCYFLHCGICRVCRFKKQCSLTECTVRVRMFEFSQY
ncbi:hypothetical protein KC19_1G312700 [Ceratodon purpureus]|uniref:Nas2 N-terminal domain-containing protein n=1 Tax=Ceratodon purpureus TaxID=3225 RepID=A0A8T0JEA0_CERPU|nr:hypothetical protein KC19_1G312700 [Ceratodon purpureus]